MCDMCWVSDIYNDSQILSSVCDIVLLVTQITETGYGRYTTMQYVWKQDKHDAELQRKPPPLCK